MNTEKIIYETGATSHAVNDLILLTDNTRELAEKRDSIYRAMHQMDLIAKSANLSTDWDNTHFIKLLRDAKTAYYIEFAAHENAHINGMTSAENREFCQLYLDDYDNWKSENGYI